MVREICKDEVFLAQKAEPATAEDLGVAQDLLDAITAHKDSGVGKNQRIGALEVSACALTRCFVIIPFSFL